MRKLSFLLTIILLLTACMMTACKGDDTEETTPQDSAPEVTTPEETTPEPVKPVVHASISLEQLINYEIVAAKSSSDETDKLTKELQQAMQNAFGLPINLKTENAYNTTQYEILIGHTNREESETFLADLKWDDYGYAIVGDKLVIAGKNEDGTFAALRAFIDYVKGYTGGDIFFSNADQYTFIHSYPHQSITVNGVSAAELSILCNQQELGGVAEIIRNSIIEACGIAVPIITDADVVAWGKLFVVGNSVHITQDAWISESVDGNDYSIHTAEEVVWLNANTVAGYYIAATELAMQLSGKGDENVVLTDGKREGNDKLTAMSFNLMAGIKANDKRVDRVIEIILKYRPAVIGVQEATDTWIALLEQRLDGIYTVVGEGRNADGGDEHSAILYLTEEFDCLESGTKWLSDTPDVAGSKFSESHYTRIMTYVHLSRKSDGKEFLHVNTHLDYGSTPEEEAVKVAQMQVIFDQIAKFSNIPTIITGDFNAIVGSPVYQMITELGYQDTIHYIPAADRAPTYHGLMGTTGTPSHIDFVFSKQMEYSSYYRICTERVDNENVSDHYPIFAVLSFLPEGK